MILDMDMLNITQQINLVHKENKGDAILLKSFITIW